MITQNQSQRQQLKILPQQIQLLNLYFLNSMELEQRIKNELEENPFLDVAEKKEEENDLTGIKEEMQDFQDWEEVVYNDVPDYKADYQNYFDSEVAPNAPIINVNTFKEDARQQLSLLNITEEEKKISEYVVDILDQHGFMDYPLEEVADDMSFHFNQIIDAGTVRHALDIVQSLDPIGIGSCSIQDCLLLQLQRMDVQKADVKCAINLIQNYYDELTHRKFEKLQFALKIDDEQLRSVLNLISGLNFHPVYDPTSFDPKNTIIPDFIITNYGVDVQVNLYSSRSASVFVNQSLYDQLADQISKKDKSAGQYVKSKLSSAQWFVNAVKQREETMLKIMKCITDWQKEYFIEGDIRYLKPMVLRNISDVSGLDISTISRITGNKYAETHFGIIYLKNLFSEGIADKKGEVISNKVIQSVIEEAIKAEDKKHPYTDQQLVNILSLKGYNIARRTIAKYREHMQIPIAQIRAVWA